MLGFLKFVIIFNETPQGRCLNTLRHESRNFIPLLFNQLNTSSIVTRSIEANILQRVNFLHPHIYAELSHTDVFRFQIVKMTLEFAYVELIYSDIISQYLFSNEWVVLSAVKSI